MNPSKRQKGKTFIQGTSGWSISLGLLPPVLLGCSVWEASDVMGERARGDAALH